MIRKCTNPRKTVRVSCIVRENLARRAFVVSNNNLETNVFPQLQYSFWLHKPVPSLEIASAGARRGESLEIKSGPVTAHD